MQRPSLPSFLAGFIVALSLAAVPATAALQGAAAIDPNPNTFDGTAPLLSMKPVAFVTGASIDAAP